MPSSPPATAQPGRWLWAAVLGLVFPLGACERSESADGVIVVCLDTLRADHLGAYGSTAGLTPNLDRFAAEAVVFDQAHAQANETLYSHASLFTSLYPSELDSLDTAFRVPAETPTLASVFGDAGWATAAFVAGGHLSAAFGLGRGFQTYDDSESWGSLRDTGTRALKWLDGRARLPFLLFVHGYDTHDRTLKPPPFGYRHADPDHRGLATALGRRPGATSTVVEGAVPSSTGALYAYTQVRPRLGQRSLMADDPDAQSLTPADLAHLRGLYAGSVAWADAAFGLFLAGLEARGLLESATVVLLSDHGEDLGEHGSFNHRYGLSDETVRVPLMVRLPGGEGGGRRVGGLAELVDVSPTLWSLAGLQPPVGVRGRSLQAAVEGSPTTGGTLAFSQGALRLLSVRDAQARLTASGLSAHNPVAASLIAATPIDGVGLRLVGQTTRAEPLRAALVAQLNDLALPQQDAP